SKWTIASTVNSSLTVGNGGTLNVRDGAQVSATVASLSNSGALSATGANSVLDIGNNLKIGGAGTGTMYVTDGAKASSLIGDLGYDANSIGTVIVDDAGSDWTSSSLSIGLSGIGNLQIYYGGSGTGFIVDAGVASGSTGEVLVEGTAASLTTANNFSIGAGGTGRLTM